MSSNARQVAPVTRPCSAFFQLALDTSGTQIVEREEDLAIRVVATAAEQFALAQGPACRSSTCAELGKPLIIYRDGCVVGTGPVSDQRRESRPPFLVVPRLAE
jgi:hypothetical protein